MRDDNQSEQSGGQIISAVFLFTFSKEFTAVKFAITVCYIAVCAATKVASDALIYLLTLLLYYL